jgi:DNA-directed RNA polymerase specialized sigma24 family protein
VPEPVPKPSLVERLFAEQRGALKAFFRRRTGAGDAADLSQEVYLLADAADSGPTGHP